MQAPLICEQRGEVGFGPVLDQWERAGACVNGVCYSRQASLGLTWGAWPPIKEHQDQRHYLLYSRTALSR
jgi:hypothetical protein